MKEEAAKSKANRGVVQGMDSLFLALPDYKRF